MHRLSARSRLLLIAGVMEAAYMVFLVIPFPLLRYYRIPLLDLGKLTHYDPWLATTAVMLFFFGLYIVAYRTQGEPELGRTVVLCGGLFTATLILVYPIGALDIFDYAFYGREMAVYHANPYLAVPNDFAADPFLPYMGWKWLPFTYGPVWALLSWVLSLIGGNSLLANLLVYKVCVVIAYLLSTALIYRVLLHEMPQRALSGTILFAWNPLVVFEVGANGHNDILLVLFAVLAIVTWARSLRAASPPQDGGQILMYRVLSLVAIAVSALTKFVTAPLGIIWLMAGLRSWHDWRRRMAFVLASALLVAGVTVFVYAPFADSLPEVKLVVLTPVRRQQLFTSSFPTLLAYATTDRLGQATAQKLARNLAAAALVLVTLYHAWHVRNSWQDLTRRSYNVLLFYLLFVCLWFQPWYVVWLVPLAALIPAGRESTTVILFSLSAAAKYLVFDFIWYMNPDILTTSRIETLAVIVIYTLPLAYLLLSGVRRRAASAR